MTPKRANLLIKRFRAGYRAEQEIRTFCSEPELGRQVQLGPIEEAPLFIQKIEENFTEFSRMVDADLQCELGILNPTNFMENVLRHRRFMAKIHAHKNLNFENGDGI